MATEFGARFRRAKRIASFRSRGCPRLYLRSVGFAR